MPASQPDPAMCGAERDAIAFLGLMAQLYLNWDPPITVPVTPPESTHFHGLNIHALIVDNTDGEVVALQQNQIHRDNSPLQHAEQIAVRAAIARIELKRPRDGNTTVEEYYRHKLFYAAGTTPEDFTYKGCTLWTTLEPCPMCAATLCVCRMKRVAYLVPDMKFGGSWDGRLTGGKGLKDTYYAQYDLQYGQPNPAGSGTICRKAGFMYAALLAKIGVLRAAKVLDTLFFDELHDELKAAFGHFWSISEGDLSTQGTDRDKNLRTLLDLRKLCNNAGVALIATAGPFTCSAALSLPRRNDQESR
jgi:tRNA(Arg) A34 adenosine deaminase TadA